MPSSEEDQGHLALSREVARRLALMLERESLLQEAATIDALRAVDRAKSNFIATTAHELRTPLTSLQATPSYCVEMRSNRAAAIAGWTFSRWRQHNSDSSSTSSAPVSRS